MEPDDFELSDPPVEGVAIDHLWNAAHETLRALRMLVDAADEFVESQRAERPATRAGTGVREGRVHRIDIDLDSDHEQRRAERDPRFDAGTDAGFGSSEGAS
jgi:hypothetical protein